MITGVLKPEEAFAGFANTGLMTIAALSIVAAGLRETGAIVATCRTRGWGHVYRCTGRAVIGLLII
jgi:hypothetical protein